jgi:hypothetical protein
MPIWTSTAPRTASTALENSTSMPSPVVLTIRPRCLAMVGSRRVFLTAFSRAKVPSSSAPMRRLYPATSAASTAASRRSTRSTITKAPKIRNSARRIKARRAAIGLGPMSLMGQTKTSAGQFGMSDLSPIADIFRLHAQVRLVPKAALSVSTIRSPQTDPTSREVL